jgi:hypothetical protein
VSSKGDRVATLLFSFALLPLVAICWTQVEGRKQGKAVEALRREVGNQQQKTAQLNERLRVVEARRPLLAKLQGALISPEGGSPYAQILLLTEEVRRQTGARFPSYAFGSPGAAGTLPRYSITGTATGSESSLLAFLRGLEEGPNRVQITSIAWQANGVQVMAGNASATGQPVGAPPSGTGEVTATVTFVYTGAPLATEQQAPATSTK